MMNGGEPVGASVLTSLRLMVGWCEGQVSDLMALATDTHKFESRYLDQLVGEYACLEPPPGKG